MRGGITGDTKVDDGIEDEEGCCVGTGTPVLFVLLAFGVTPVGVSKRCDICCCCCCCDCCCCGRTLIEFMDATDVASAVGGTPTFIMLLALVTLRLIIDDGDFVRADVAALRVAACA